jgi:hypothetical protein
MTKMRHFVAVLARTGKSMNEIKILTDQAYLWQYELEEDTDV